MAEGKISRFIETKTSSTTSYSKIGDLFITKMLSNPNYKTEIRFMSDQSVVTGFSEGPFALQAKANYKPVADFSSAEQALSDVKAGVQMVWGAGNAATGATVSPETLQQANFKCLRATELRWAGSDSPVFNLKLIIPSYDRGALRKPKDQVKRLLRCIYPTYENEWSMLAPENYKITPGATAMQDIPVNTCTITRGKYFRAAHQLITSVSVTMSQEIMEDGQPLYFEANIDFVPWRTPDANDIIKYLV